MIESDKLIRLKELFSQLFLSDFNTRLVSGHPEPFYKAATANESAIIYSREDFLSSALHEIAHWSIAGESRRQLDDFGYWYQPDGRDPQAQKVFESVEVRPQAVEWALSIAMSHGFHCSADNLAQDAGVSAQFQLAVLSQLEDYWKRGLPQRAQQLFNALIEIYHLGYKPSWEELKQTGFKIRKVESAC